MSRIIVKNGKMTVKLYSDEADSFLAKAIEKSKRYESLAPKNKSPYGFNHAHSQYVGMVAEHAAWLLFTEIEDMLQRDLKIDAAYQNPSRDGECDIYVNGLRIEVKSIKYGSWLNYGPCISTRQLKNIERKADVVIWLLYNEKQQEFSFEGFNYVKDISSVTPILTGDKSKVIINNHPVKELLHPLQDLKL